jgi:hypothetical protein
MIYKNKPRSFLKYPSVKTPSTYGFHSESPNKPTDVAFPPAKTNLPTTTNTIDQNIWTTTSFSLQTPLNHTRNSHTTTRPPSCLPFTIKCRSN